MQLVLNLLQNRKPLATKRKLKKIEGEMKCFFQFQREQRELDRQHESRMMQLIMTMQQQQKQLLISPPAPLAPQHRYDNAASTLPSRHFQNLLPPPPTCPWCTKIFDSIRCLYHHHQDRLTITGPGIQSLKIRRILSFQLLEKISLVI